jgi:TolB protein
MRLKFQPIFIFLVMCCVGKANAILHLELTHGMSKAIPVGVKKFEGASFPYILSTTISGDFNHSGDFQSKKVKSKKLKKWRAAGLDYVVTGIVESLPSGKLRVTFTLFNTYHAKQSKREAMLSKTFTIEATKQRALAHHISDLMYKKLVGVRGIFSTRIAYVIVKGKIGQAIKHQLMISDYDGFNPKPVLTSKEPVMSPAWSPSGKKLAYVSFEHTLPVIYIVDVVTGKRHTVTHLSGINGAPAFAPNGDYLAFVSSETGFPKIYIKNLSSGEITKMTNGHSLDTEPAFSPDGKSLLFTSNRGGTPQVYQLNFKRGGIERLTYSGVFNARASYSLDGKKILMMHREAHSRHFQIALQDLDTDNLMVLTNSKMNRSPSFSPNGKMILYATETRKGELLAIVSTDGKVRFRMPDNEGRVQDPAWST